MARRWGLPLVSMLVVALRGRGWRTAVVILASALLAGLIYSLGGWLLPARLALLAALALPVFLFTLLLIKHIRFTIALLIVYAPVEIFVQKWLPGDAGLASRYITEGLLLVLFLVVVVDRLLSDKPWKRTPLDIPLLLFVLIGVLSAVVNGLPAIVWGMGQRILLRYALLFYLVVQVGFNRQQTRRLLAAMLAMAGFVMAVGLLQAVLGPPMNQFLRIPDIVLNATATRKTSGFFVAHGRYIFSTLGRYDAFGIYALYILLLVVAYMLHHRPRRRTWAWLAAATLICLVLTLSRQSWLAMYAALWCWVVLSRKKWAVMVLSVLVLVPVLIMLAAFFFPDLGRYSGAEQERTVLTRILSSVSDDYLRVSSGSGGRLFVLRYVSERILELAPVLGFGPGHFGTITAQYFGYSDAQLLGMEQKDVYLVFDVNWVTLLGQYGALGCWLSCLF